jgi:ribosomal protein S18 acetylase RimI-like enzyme
MTIAPAHVGDLVEIRAARAFQRDLGASLWPDFPDAAIRAEIAAGRQRVVRDEDGVLAGIFVAVPEDPAIWGELERGEHLYLHRIARAAGHPGRGLFRTVLDWARDECRRTGRAGVRMDTWSSNGPLIAYYERQGFHLVGRRTIPPDPRLPPAYHGLELALLQLDHPWEPT